MTPVYIFHFNTAPEDVSDTALPAVRYDTLIRAEIFIDNY